MLAAHIAREVYVQVSRSDLDSFLYETNSDDTKTLEETGKEISEETPNEHKEILIGKSFRVWLDMEKIFHFLKFFSLIFNSLPHNPNF